MRPQSVVFVEPPFVCWDRRMDRVRAGEEDVFVPHGFTPEVLERYFRRAYRAFYTRPDVLWGLAKTLAVDPARGSEALAS